MFAALFLAAAALPITPQDGPIDLKLAHRYFQEAQWLSDDDNGLLWGMPLIGPMIFVDVRSHDAVTNRQPPDEAFKEEDGLWVGHWPTNKPIANTATEWGNQEWTMVLWPLPTRRTERAKLMAHELFHRIQPALGLNPMSPDNAQMDKFDGRVWLRMELMALSKALSAPVSEKKPFMEDALLFRAYRQSLFPGSKKNEDELDLNEGLAEFTGIMLKGTWEPEARLWQGNQLKQIADTQLSTYSRSFPYWTGSSYALLLDVEDGVQDAKTPWRKQVKPDTSLAGTLAERIGWHESVDEKTAVARAEKYGYDKVLKEEQEKEKKTQELIAKYHRQFFDGPVLVLPLAKMQYSFDPRDVFHIDEGTVYGTATIIDEWGTLTVTGGALITPDFQSARVEAPKSAGDLSGTGWTLKLNDGWKVVAGKRKGDFTVVKT